MILVSLCLIAKNEARFLEGCLQSVRAVVDEIILVDTGSDDATIEIAKRFGAKILLEPWQDDFAKPRNRALREARGRFVLQLDADERLSEVSAQKIREAVKRDDFDCALLPLHNAKDDADLPGDIVSGKTRHGEVMHLPRLFRKTETLRYDGVVHESITASLRESGGRIVFVPADIIHYGATDKIRLERGKAGRNIRLLEQRVFADPTDHVARGYLAAELLNLGREEEAWAESETAWTIATGQAPSAYDSVHRLAVFRALMQQRRGDLYGSLDTIAIAEQREQAHPDFDFLQGSAFELLALGCPEQSSHRERHLGNALRMHRAALARSTHLYAQRFVNGAAGPASWERIGTIALMGRDHVVARSAFEKLTELDPKNPAGPLGLTEAALLAGDPKQALEAVLPLLGEEPESPDAWTLAALAAEAAGLLDDALGFCRRARLRLSQGYLAPHRKYELLALVGRLSAYNGSAAGGPGIDGALLSIVARQPFEAGARLGVSAPPYVVERLTLGLLRADQAAHLEPLFSLRAELSFPGLIAQIKETLANVGASVEDDGQAMPYVVIADEPDDADFVVATLNAHLEPLRMAHPELAWRPIERCSRNEAAAKLSGTPFATLVLVDDAMVELPADFAGRLTTLRFDVLLANPVVELAKLLADLDLPSGAAGLRYIVEHYPGARPRPAGRSLKASFVRSRA